MSETACKKELLCFLQKPVKDVKVVVMPDFFLDRIINLEWDTTEFSILITDVAKRKGGSLDGISQTDLRGGNAINVASALASLGATVTPIVCTSEFGLQLIKYNFQNTSINISHIKTQGKASITTALEFQNQNSKNYWIEKRHCHPTAACAPGLPVSPRGLLGLGPPGVTLLRPAARTVSEEAYQAPG